MKNVFKLSFASLATILISSSAVYASAYPKFENYINTRLSFWQKMSEIPEGDTAKFDDFLSKDYPAFSGTMDAAIDELRASSVISNKLIANAIEKVKIKFNSFKLAYETGNVQSLGVASEELQAAVENEDRIFEQEYNKAKSTDSRLMYIYGGLAGFFCLLSAYLFAWSRKPTRTRTENPMHQELVNKLAQQSKNELFKSSLIASGAAVVTLVWYLSVRNNGGSYMIFWGPMLFGGLALFSGIINYNKSRRNGTLEKAARSSIQG